MDEDMEILDDTESLLRAQEGINIKTCLLTKKIEAIYLDMKEENLKGWKKLLKKKKRIVDDTDELQGNPQQCKTEVEDNVCEGDALGPHTTDKNEVVWVSSTAATAISNYQTQWKRQQNKKVLSHQMGINLFASTGFAQAWECWRRSVTTRSHGGSLSLSCPPPD